MASLPVAISLRPLLQFLHINDLQQVKGQEQKPNSTEQHSVRGPWAECVALHQRFYLNNGLQPLHAIV